MTETLPTPTITTPALFRASAPPAQTLANLGPLADLPGTWMGNGFNLISLPDKQDNKPFRLRLTATRETLTFTSIGAPIPNRGSQQGDIAFLGLHYFQQVSDAATNEGKHVEPGLWLNLPATTTPQSGPTIARLGTIPHGDSLLAQGTSFTVNGGPKIDSADPLPFVLDQKGARLNEEGGYLAPFDSAPLPPGIPAEAKKNPNLILTNAIKGQKIAKTVVLFVNATPVGGINGTPIAPQPENVGGILNIPFVTANANVKSFSAIFWIETVENADGTQFLQLQYTQTVILDFIGILWPHISVATLVKQ